MTAFIITLVLVSIFLPSALVYLSTFCVPCNGDIITSDHKTYRVLDSCEALPDHLVAIEIDPITKEVRYDAHPVYLDLDEIKIVELADRDKS